jgi:hypothetical protein
VEVVTDAPHSMHWERPDLFNDAIRRFVKEVASVADSDAGAVAHSDSYPIGVGGHSA